MGLAGQRALQSLTYVPVIHPEMLLLYPVLGLYAHNMGKLPLEPILRPALVLLIAAVLLWISLSIVLRGVHRAGIATSILIFAALSGWNVLESMIRAAIPALDSAPAWTILLAYPLLAAACLYAIIRYKRIDPESPASMRRTVLSFVALTILIAAITFIVVGPVMPLVGVVMIAGYFCVVAACLGLMLQYRGDFRRLTQTVNWFAGVLLLLSVANILWQSQNKTALALPPVDRASVREARAATPETPYPDIYLFALDGYARSSVLRSEFGYNNQPFVDSMKSMGFQEIPQTLANYPQSAISIASMLNLDYLHKAVGDAAKEASLSDVVALYHHNRTFAFLRDMGYQLESFAPGVDSLELCSPAVDVCYKPRLAVTEFEQVLLANSAAAPFADGFYYLRNNVANYWSRSFQRRHIEYALTNVGPMAAQRASKPRFVFCHLSLPDQPFFFTREGGWAKAVGASVLNEMARPTLGEYRESYVEQVHYVNRRLQAAAEQILTNASRPTVILIVSSRGPAFEPLATPVDPAIARFRYANFVMARFPENFPGAPMPNSIGLVNVMRYALDRVFGLSLPMLPDETYISAEGKPLVVEPIASPEFTE